MLLFMGDSVRVDIAVAANSGRYLMPIDQRLVPEKILPRVFANRLFILLGERDTDINGKSLNRSPAAMTQGAHRLARGHYFFSQSKAQAAALDTPFNWELIVVPEVAHSDKGMSETAVKVLFND